MNQELRERLSVLSNDQIQTIVDSFAYATVLIAGADGCPILDHIMMSID